MPVRIWTMSRVSDALPKTYHQPIGPAASRGMGCRIIGSRAARRRKRASNQLPTASSQRFMAGFLVGVEPVTPDVARYLVGSESAAPGLPAEECRQLVSLGRRSGRGRAG